MSNPSLRIKSLLAVAALSAMVTDYRPLRQKSNYDYSGWDETIDTGRRKQKADDALSKAQAKRDRKAAKRAAIAARLGVRPVWVPVRAATRIAALEEGQADLVIATMGHNTQRDAQARFIRPHYYLSETIIVGPRDTAVGDWNDLSGRSICVTVGNYANSRLVSRGARLLLFDGALFGVVNMLRATLKARPDYAAFVVDAPGKTFRDDLYPAYKANRDPAPEELKRQFAHCRAVCAALGLTVLGHPDYEADDLIGSALVQARYGFGPLFAATTVLYTLGVAAKYWLFLRNRA
mgnify:CR=1 FL=1